MDLAKPKSGAPVSLFSGSSLYQDFLLVVEKLITLNLMHQNTKKGAINLHLCAPKD